MRIGIDCRMYRSGVAGIGRYSQNLVKNLLELDHDDEFVLFMTDKDAKEFKNFEIKNSLKIKNYKLIIANIAHYSLAEQTKFGKIIEKENLDLMHFLNFNFPVSYKRKFVVTIHDLTLYFYPETAKETNYFKRSAFKYVMKKACQNSEKIIAVSESTKNDIIKIYKTDKNKIIVIHEAADDPTSPIILSQGYGRQVGLRGASKKTEVLVQEIKTRYALSDTPVLLSVGQFRPHKNLPKLVEAFDLLRKNTDCKLVILGKTDSKHQTFYRAIKTSKYQKDIIMPGFVSDEELTAWYKLATLFVFPSLYEGFGLPGLEAMQAGLPVATSNKASLPEIYGKAAIYFDPLKIEDIAGKMKLVLENKSLRAKMITEGKVVAQSYSWQKTASETLNLYRQIQK